MVDDAEQKGAITPGKVLPFGLQFLYFLYIYMHLKLVVYFYLLNIWCLLCFSTSLYICRDPFVNVLYLLLLPSCPILLLWEVHVKRLILYWLFRSWSLCPLKERVSERLHLKILCNYFFFPFFVCILKICAPSSVFSYSVS